ncbi:DUF1775 domain-containing protein [Streptomyces sp. NBC_00687]|uniref:DUF1775 domain-containing protein n=1 Tax=Streptomyces sp. NBC_00687 TaxID=2975807 RepID=UPI00224DF504|nr:DUF1775 domain-containing protein [Streptomyces sp. NBC_00687]MCX4920023.1 DUF1775 domain-containing protein [Streptomyces sp. NBC_00687]
MPTRPAARMTRLAVVCATALSATLALAGTASAHAEVEADKAQALAKSVHLTFVSEAESKAAGFTELRIVLPKGIAPADVSLAKAPKGWKLKPTTNGYSVGGPALKPGVDAEHTIEVRQLPDAKELAFKTVETYSDGKVSRWIELAQGGKEPEQPAPVLKLKAAAPGATPIAPSSPASTPTPTPTPSEDTASPSASTTPVADEADDDAGPKTGLIVGGVVVLLGLLGAGAWWLAKRRASSASN